jgi:hypothetical protein
MTAVANSTGVFATLNYNFDDPNGAVNVYSANTQAHLNTMPAFIESWQAQDIANNDVGGYFKNPVNTYVNTIITYSAGIRNNANAAIAANSVISGLDNIVNVANSLATTANAFLAHTNRISGVTPYTGQDDTIPYYDTAMGLGKSAVYITNQTDGIINSAPTMGSFTSVLVGPQVYANANTITADIITLTQVIAGNVSNTQTNTQISQIQTDLTNINSHLSGRQTNDYTFYTNLKSMVDKYNQVKKFSNMGETQQDLIQNYIGSDKLLTRLNA